MQPRGVYDWLRRRRYVVDAAIVAVLAVLTWFLTTAGARRPVEVALYAGLLGPLLWRRRFPVAVFVAVSLACGAQLLLLDAAVGADIGFLFALYAVSAYAQRRWTRLAALSAGLAGAGLAALDWGAAGVPWRDRLVLFAALAVLVAFAWTLGDLLRTRRAYVAELEERARLLEAERDQQARLARAAERARIARELHDVVAHSLSVVVAQADGGSYAAAQDPPAAQRALATIAETGRQALAEMRRLLGVLRAEPDPAALLPQPGLAEIPELVAQVRRGNLPVSLDIAVDAGRLTPAAQLTAYRVVQEALTNTLKHAGPHACATVRLETDGPDVRVEVSDDGRGAAAPGDGRGQGIAGMRERVAAHGGTLVATPRPGGGFVVSALLPGGGLP